MTENKFYGILKFFSNEDYLNDLCNGVFYCNTPEFYRLHEGEGVSDHTESCSASYRNERGDRNGRIVIQGKHTINLTNFTMRSAGEKDSWLHCWTTVLIPNNDKELNELISNFNRLRNEFGLNYAYIRPANIKPFISLLSNLTKNDVRAGDVKYSPSFNEWSPCCKNIEYKYQREFRFLIGECPELSVDPLIIRCPNKFKGLIEKNLRIDLCSKDGKYVWFALNGSREFVTRKDRDKVEEIYKN